MYNFDDGLFLLTCKFK